MAEDVSEDDVDIEDDYEMGDDELDAMVAQMSRQKGQKKRQSQRSPPHKKFKGVNEIREELKRRLQGAKR